MEAQNNMEDSQILRNFTLVLMQEEVNKRCCAPIHIILVNQNKDTTAKISLQIKIKLLFQTNHFKIVFLIPSLLNLINEILIFIIPKPVIYFYKILLTLYQPSHNNVCN